MESNKPLSGFRTVCFESRLSHSAASLLERKGSTVIRSPSMQEIPLEDNHDVFRFGKRFFANEIDILICTTGVGTKMLVDALETRYKKAEILEALENTTIVVRGPKPVRVLKKLDVPFDVTTPEPNTWKEMLEAIDRHEKTKNLDGKTVAIQEYGESNPELMEGLEERGAEIIQVPVYRWALPDDIGPLMEGIQALLDGQVDIALFTSKTQINHVMKVAEKEGISEDLKKAFNKTFVASIGPVCSKGIQDHGLTVDFEPSRPKLGVFIKEVSTSAPSKNHIET